MAITVALLSPCCDASSRSQMVPFYSTAAPEGGQAAANKAPSSLLEPLPAAADSPVQPPQPATAAAAPHVLERGERFKLNFKHHHHHDHAPPAPDLPPPPPLPSPLHGGQPPAAPGPESPAWPFPWPCPGDHWPPFPAWPPPGDKWPPLPPFPAWPRPGGQWPAFPFHPPPMPAWPWPNPGNQWPPAPPTLHGNGVPSTTTQANANEQN